MSKRSMAPVLLILMACASSTAPAPITVTPTVDESPAESVKVEIPPIDGFDFPVGPPDGTGYYDAQGYGGRNSHLGEDWNGVGGGNTDLGDPVYAVAHGMVVVAEDIGGGWGNVVRVLHLMPEGKETESVYAHFDTITVESGEMVTRGQQLGTIGTNGGQYVAHLHLEMRTTPGLSIGGGYGEPKQGQFAPTPFIGQHRPAR